MLCLLNHWVGNMQLNQQESGTWSQKCIFKLVLFFPKSTKKINSWDLITKIKTSTAYVLQQQSGEPAPVCWQLDSAYQQEHPLPRPQPRNKAYSRFKKAHMMGIYCLADNCQALRSTWGRSSQSCLDQTSHNYLSLSIHPHVLPGLPSPLVS